VAFATRMALKAVSATENFLFVGPSAWRWPDLPPRRLSSAGGAALRGLPSQRPRDQRLQRLQRRQANTGAAIDTAATSVSSVSAAGFANLDDVVVVCPPSRSSQWSAVQQQLAVVGAPQPQRWTGVDGSAEVLRPYIPQFVDAGLVEPGGLPDELMEESWRERWQQEGRWGFTRNCPWAAGIDLNCETLGHALSHLSLWQELAKRPADSACLVLEDDCELPPEFSERLLAARLADVPQDWGLVFLGGADVLPTREEHQASYASRHLHPWFRPGSAYVITGRGAAAALQHCTPLRWQLWQQLLGSHTAFQPDDAEKRIYRATEEPSACYYLDPPIAGRAGADGQQPGRSPAEGLSEQELFEQLDAVVAWATRLSNRMIHRGWREGDVEGHTQLVAESREIMAKLAGGEGVETICEIGFNAGHGTLRWLLANPRAKVYSFDLGEHIYSRAAARWLQKMFPGRLEVMWGDSTRTLEIFRVMHPEVKCDIAFVDGCHEYEVAIVDLRNMREMVRPGHRVLMDDIYLPGPRDAWNELVESAEAVELDRSIGLEPGVGVFGFAVGQFAHVEAA